MKNNQPKQSTKMQKLPPAKTRILLPPAKQKPPILLPPPLRRRSLIPVDPQQRMPTRTKILTQIPPSPPSQKKATGRQQKNPKRMLFLCACLLLLTILLPTVGYTFVNNRYQYDLELARTGIADLDKAITAVQALSHNPFDVEQLGRAQQHFSNTLGSLYQLQNDLSLVPDEIATMPGLNTQLPLAKRFVPLLIQISEAGLESCITLEGMFRTLLPSTNPNTSGITQADVNALHEQYQKLKDALNQANTLLSQQSPGLFKGDQGLGKLIDGMKTHLPSFQQGMPQTDLMLDALPALLGINEPAHYLVELLDTAQLTPGGGIIGNYAIVTLTNGRISASSINDTDLLTTQKRSVLPKTYNWFTNNIWDMRYASLEAHYPTMAKYSEQMYRDYKNDQRQFTGIAAITPELIQDLLKVTGPVNVPEYGELINHQNLTERLHYYQLEKNKTGPANGAIPAKDGNSSVRKHFTALLGNNFVKHLEAQPDAMRGQMTNVLVKALQHQDIRMYFNHEKAQQALHMTNMDGSIQAPDHDYLFVTQGSIEQNKAHEFITQTILDDITIDGNGTATHNTRIEFAWNKKNITAKEFYGHSRYHSYLRLHLPENSQLTTKPQWQAKDNGIYFGQQFWGGYVQFPYPQTTSVSFSWQEPNALQRDAGGAHYRYLVRHQVGAKQNVSVQVNNPACPSITSTSSNVTASGNGTVNLVQALVQDEKMQISYKC